MASKSVICEGIEYDIGYEMFHPEKKDVVLILHGWGANRAIMKQAFKGLFDEFKLIFVDLPGFGGSSIEKPLDTYGYAKVVEAFLSLLNVTPLVIMGHSFGGKVATLLQPKNLVLLSSAGILHKKSFKVRCKIRLFKLFKMFGLGKFYNLFASNDVQNMSQTMYETFKKVVDEDFSEHFRQCASNGLIFWGEDDTATPLKSGEKIAKLMEKSEFFPLKGDHFFFLKNGEFIYKKIKENLC